MPATLPRVVATRFASVRHKPADAAGTLRAVVEYNYTSGPYRAAKYEVVSTGAKNEEDVRDDVKEDLLTHLNAMFPTETKLKARDILLFGF
jgi:hypothetical protein